MRSTSVFVSVQSSVPGPAPGCHDSAPGSNGLVLSFPTVEKSALEDACFLSPEFRKTRCFAHAEPPRGHTNIVLIRLFSSANSREERCWQVDPFGDVQHLGQYYQRVWYEERVSPKQPAF